MSDPSAKTHTNESRHTISEVESFRQELKRLEAERDRLRDDSEYERDRQYDRGYALGLKAGWQHATTYWEAVRQEDAGKTPSPTPEQLRERHRVSFEAHFYPSAALTQREGGGDDHR